ncbi:hypothetical protein ABIB49_001067 [Arthrobacter sp. UYCu512]
MSYPKIFLRAVEYEKVGIFGLTNRWTYEFIKPGMQEKRLGTKELLRELVPGKDDARQDAYDCISRAQKLFNNSQSGWVWYPWGTVVSDLNSV